MTKINNLKDIDLSQYKLADYPWAMYHEYSHYQVMKLAESWALEEDESSIRIALIPKDKRLTDCSGDGWDNRPACHNASWFYKYPEGTIFLEGVLGKELVLITS